MRISFPKDSLCNIKNTSLEPNSFTVNSTGETGSNYYIDVNLPASTSGGASSFKVLLWDRYTDKHKSKTFTINFNYVCPPGTRQLTLNEPVFEIFNSTAREA